LKKTHHGERRRRRWCGTSPGILRTLGTAIVVIATALIRVPLRAQAPQTAETIQKVRTYVSQWQQALSSLVAEELYTQRLHVRLGSTFGSSKTLQLKSDVLLIRSQNHWIGFRDVGGVDGQTIEGRSRRLEELFLKHPFADAVLQARQINDESARYNLGSLYRNFNVPTTALQILEPEREGRVEFTLERSDVIEGQPASVLSFREKMPPTIIFDSGARKAVYTHGRLWVIQSTGQILATELQWRLIRGGVRLDAVVNVSYHPDTKSGIWVPWKMTEKYETQKESLDCAHAYNPRRGIAAAGMIGERECRTIRRPEHVHAPAELGQPYRRAAGDAQPEHMVVFPVGLFPADTCRTAWSVTGVSGPGKRARRWLMRTIGQTACNREGEKQDRAHQASNRIKFSRSFSLAISSGVLPSSFLMVFRAPRDSNNSVAGTISWLTE
jgi:hypothetical protein